MANMTTRTIASAAERIAASSYLWGHTSTGPAVDRRFLITDFLTKDASGNSRLGTTSNLNFNARMGIQSSGNQTVLELFDGGGANTCQIALSNAAWLAGVASVAGNLVFQTGGLTERARITDAGNLSIGGTAATARLNIRGGALAGDLGINMAGELTAGRVVTGGGAGSTHAIHGASDFTALELSQGSTSGYVSAISIGARSFAGSFGDSVQFITRSTVKLYIEGTAGHVIFGTDNLQDLGSASRRGKVAYFGTGTINTSDKREKTEIGEIPDTWLDAWADVQWSQYKFIGGSRWHVGLVAQQVHAAFAAHDLDAFSIGLCCFDAWEEQREPIFENVTKTRKATRTEQIAAGENEQGEPLFTLKEVEFEEEYEETVDTGATRVTLEAGDRWGLRYDECQAIEAAWQRREISRLTDRLAALESPTS